VAFLLAAVAFLLLPQRNTILAGSLLLWTTKPLAILFDLSSLKPWTAVAAACRYASPLHSVTSKAGNTMPFRFLVAPWTWLTLCFLFATPASYITKLSSCWLLRGLTSTTPFLPHMSLSACCRRRCIITILTVATRPRALIAVGRRTIATVPPYHCSFRWTQRLTPMTSITPLLHSTAVVTRKPVTPRFACYRGYRAYILATDTALRRRLLPTRRCIPA